MFINWPWPAFLPSRMTVTHKLFKILSGHSFCIKCRDLDLVTSKFIGVIYCVWPTFLPSTTTVTHKLFQILSGHDVANGWTDGQKDRGHTIIRPKFHFGCIKVYIKILSNRISILWHTKYRKAGFIVSIKLPFITIHHYCYQFNKGAMNVSLLHRQFFQTVTTFMSEQFIIHFIVYFNAPCSFFKQFYQHT